MAHLIGQGSTWAQLQHLLETSCHIFLTGPAGSGKSALVKALLKQYATTRGRPQLDAWGEETTEECLLLTPDQDRGIQTIRNHVTMFIRQMAPATANAKYKPYRWVIIDDVDTFPQISQQALRRPMETYSHITRFIFIGNSTEDLIPALRSRCIHVTMNSFDLFEHHREFLVLVGMPHTEMFSEEVWSWILNTCQNNVSDLIRLLRLIRDILQTMDKKPTVGLIQTICSTPFHLDFIPLLTALSEKDLLRGTHQIIEIWKRGYTFEDILESFQTIHGLFGEGTPTENTLVHLFLLNAWIAYCKGNTSVLSLQNVFYKTLKEPTLKVMVAEDV
jgi:energy-coupling factor transporter ATP-binding protein EcfA2